MRLHAITALLLVAPCVGALAAQDTTQAQKPAQKLDTVTLRTSTPGIGLSDDVVLRQIHRANQEGIRMGQLAQRNGSSAQVKQYGARLVRDHQAADQKVVALAKQLRIALPQEPGQMSSSQSNDANPPGAMGRRDSTADSTTLQGYTQTNQQPRQTPDQQQNQRLRSLHGVAFDTAFANAVVQGHTQAINLLELAQRDAQHEEVRSLITSLLPTLREHLQIAQSLSSGAATTSSSQQR